MKRLELAWPRRAHGFTIIEVIVVIVVIAILATMTVVGYSWVTRDAKDSARRAAAKDVAKAIRAFSLRKGKIPGVGNSASGSGSLQADGFCPSTGGGGWVFAGAYAATNGCSIGDMLVNADMMPADFWEKIPPKPGANDGKSSQLIYKCGDTTALFYYVDNETPEEVAIMDSLVPRCSTNWVNYIRTNYKHRAAIILDDIRP